MRRDLVAASRSSLAEQLRERVVGELRLLQADHVGPPLVQPRQQARHRCFTELTFQVAMRTTQTVVAQARASASFGEVERAGAKKSMSSC